MQIHYVVFFAVSSNAINVYFNMPILLNHYNDMFILNHDCDITRLLYLQLKILDVPHLDFVIFAAAEMSFNQASEWKNLTWARFENHKFSLCVQSSSLDYLYQKDSKFGMNKTKRIKICFH